MTFSTRSLQPLLGARRACRPACRSSSAASAGRACSATRVSSRRLTSPSRIWSTSSTIDGGRLLFDLRAGAGAAAGRVDQVLGPAVERVRPELALGDRDAVLLLEVVAELPQAADDVLLPHLVEDRLELDEPPALEVGLHVVHDQRDVVAPLGLLLGHLAEDLRGRRRRRWPAPRRRRRRPGRRSGRAILYWSREAALSRLTSVLPSRLASTRFSSSAIFSNSASRSCCLRDRLVHLLLGGGGGGLAGSALPARVVTGSVSRGAWARRLGRPAGSAFSSGELLRRLRGRRPAGRPTRLRLLASAGSAGAAPGPAADLPGHRRLVARRARGHASGPGRPASAGRRPRASGCRRCP